MPKLRLDILLTEQGLAESRAKAQALIMAGQVRVDGQVILKASTQFPPDVHLDLEKGPRYVSRGGEKLEAALTNFQLRVNGRVCADVGSSTGGFTDCLLQTGAAKVYAIDVGKGILHWKLRRNPRIVVMEETNARYIEKLAEPVSLVTIDASFISLKIILPVVRGWFEFSNGSTQISETTKQQEEDIIALIKPQFEAGRKEMARNKGVIRDPEVHKEVLMDLLVFAQEKGFSVRNIIRSPLVGPKGNVEFLVWLGLDDKMQSNVPLLVQKVLEE